MTDTEFIFYENKDTPGYDLDYVGGKSIEELKKLCLANSECIGFNTLGFLKNHIHDPKNLEDSYYLREKGQGLFVHRQRYDSMVKSRGINFHIEFDGYTFYKNLESPGHVIKNCKEKDLHKVRELADADDKCVGFNTLGELKHHIVDFVNMKRLNPVTERGGLYVKNKKTHFRVKMLCNWCSSKQLCQEWYPMCQGDYKWNNIEVTWEDKDIDFYVIINKPNPGDFYRPERTIIFHMEPWCGDSNQNWGVKTWGEWAEPDENKFLHVRTHRKFYNNGFWQLRTTYPEFMSTNIVKTKGNMISSICSSKYFDPGHIKRIDFLKYVENKNDDLVQLHIYNHDNEHAFKSYQGPHPPGFKDYGIMPYKYYFMAENNVEHNFITEKLWEPLICECLCFYWGCPNVTEHIDPRAFIQLDLDDFEKSFQIIKDAIANNEWAKRLEWIRREKQKVLNYFNFFPTLERIIKFDFQFNTNPTDAEILYRKYLPKDIGGPFNKVCIIHSTTFNHDTEILDELLRRLVETKLMDKLDAVFILNYGDFIYDPKLIKKIHLINCSHDTKQFEKPSINFLQAFSVYNPNAKILYLHTKGVSYVKNSVGYQNVTDWKNYMLYFLVEQHQLCLDLLDVYDALGCDYLTYPRCHFSGNFWWAHARYLKNKKQITSDVRHDAEWWLLNEPQVHALSLFNSETDHYLNPYPREQYDNANTLKMTSRYYQLDPSIRFKCINLARRTDRKEYMTKLLVDLNLIEQNDFFVAIDGTQLKPTEELIEQFKGNDFGSRRSFIGCALSHIGLWKELVNDNVYSKYFIIEDDIKTVPNIKFKISYVMNGVAESNLEYDIIYFGYTIYNHRLPQYEDKMKTVKGIEVREYDVGLTIGGIFGYIITKSGAQKLLDYIEQHGVRHGIDYIMFKFADEMKLKHFEVLPRLILSDYVDGVHAVDSDIQYDAEKLF